MLSTLVIVALQHSGRVFWFSFDHWLSTPWFFSRSRTRLVFSFFFTQKTFFFFLWAVIRDIFISCSWPGFFLGFFLVPWILVDIRLVNTIYIYIYIDNLCVYFVSCVDVCMQCLLFDKDLRGSINKPILFNNIYKG